jgi:hypothetical protein
MRRLCALLTLTLLACPASRRETPLRDYFLETDFGRMQLLLSIVDQQKGDVRVTIKNVTNRPLIVCRENWVFPTGLITFHIFRADDGQEVQLSSTALRGLSEVNEKDHLVELPPFGSVSGIMNLQLPNQYGITKGELDVEAEYSCPFQGPRIEHAPHRSNRVHVTLR